jgi:putative PIN family toxin of toxin-antitoxin system
MRIVLDTNVLVSGLHNPNGVPGRIVDLVLAGKLTLLYNDAILGEYADVLARPRLNISEEHVQAVIGYIRLSGERVTAYPLPSDVLPDPDDLAFAEVAITASAESLVTGNLKHFVGLKEHGVVVLSPTEFLEMFLSL